MQTVRGTKDLFQKEILKYNYIIENTRKIVINHGFQEIITPIFEFTDLFKRSLGDYSDVVSKEMYNFQDKGGESLTLRPEFTASISRAFISNGLTQNLPLKLFSHGPVFRYERPQKGRMRQFHQINAEYLGAMTPYSDAEIINLACEILEKFNILDSCELNINSLGDKESRENYREKLIEYFEKYKNDLSEGSKIRLYKNPMRILDSKDENDKKISITAPKITDYFNDLSKKYFEDLQHYLSELNIKFHVNSNLVRGLDYYTHTCFEFITDKLGSQGTILGGGRYDGLINILGGGQVAAIGFAAGIERLSLMLEYDEKQIRPVYIIAIGEKAKIHALKFAKELRFNNIFAEIDYLENTSKKFKRANKLNSLYAIIIGDEEIENNKFKLKNLDTSIEEFVEHSQLINILKENI